MEEVLGQLDSRWAAVALHLALVSVKLEAPAAALFKDARTGCAHGRPHFLFEMGGLAVEAQTHVRLWVAIANEEPALHYSRRIGLPDDVAEGSPQQAVCGRRAR